MKKQADAIVIGAGIAGSSCALLLAKQGYRTLLLDRQEFPRHKTCGEFMSPETREMLEFLGVRLLEQEFRPSVMDKAVIVMPHGGEIEAPLPGQAYGISRYKLDSLLHEKAMAAGAEIITKATVTAIRLQKGHGYEVETRQGNKQAVYQAKTVIGAYGTKKLRGMTNTDSLRGGTVYVGIKSHYNGIPLSSQVELYFCDGGYVGISPVENGTANVAALLALDRVKGRARSVADILQTAALTNAKLAARLAPGAPVQGTQVSIAPVRLSNVLEPWSQFPHIGDSMLVIPPLSGDGMSIALRSSLLCSSWTDQYLQGQISCRDWQDQYTKEANHEFSQLLGRANTIQSLALAKSNRFYPVLTRLIPGLSSYLVKATRLSEKGMLR
jgi:flavin-dependent dehydrogenase